MIFKIIKPALSAILQIALVAIALAWLLDSGAEAMGYRWQWERVPEYLAFYEDGEWWPAELLEGLVVTIKLSALALLFTLLFGLITALVKDLQFSGRPCYCPLLCGRHTKYTAVGADLPPVFCLWPHHRSRSIFYRCICSSAIPRRLHG